MCVIFQIVMYSKQVSYLKLVMEIIIIEMSHSDHTYSVQILFSCISATLLAWMPCIALQMPWNLILKPFLMFLLVYYYERELFEVPLSN